MPGCRGDHWSFFYRALATLNFSQIKTEQDGDSPGDGAGDVSAGAGREDHHGPQGAGPGPGEDPDRAAGA